MGDSYNSGAYEEIYKHPEWEKTAREYEDELGRRLYHTDYVQAAAKKALTTLSNVLNAYYGLKKVKSLDGGEESLKALMEVTATVSGEEPKVTPILEEALMANKDRSNGAGQIGIYSGAMKGATPEEKEEAKARNMQNIDAVMSGDGNLREQMTMLYNGLFLNGGYTRESVEKSRSLKNMLVNITQEDVEQMKSIGAISGNEELSNFNMDLNLLKEQRAYKDKEDLFDTYRLARDLKRGKDKGKKKGNALSRWWAGIKRAFNAAFSSKFTRKDRSKEERNSMSLGREYYESNGLGLSSREEAHGMKDGKLKWLEGQAYYQMKKPVTAEGMVQTSGPSGTTLRMLGAYRMLGASKTDMLYFRLALMAWMLTSRDHSLYEILKGSHNAGIKGKEDMTEPAAMYETIDPISKKELREKFSKDQKFPHETIYLKLVQKLWEDEEKYEPLYEKERERKMKALGSASTAAFRQYTMDGYIAMNKSQKWGGSLGGFLFKKEIKNKNAEDRKKLESIFSGNDPEDEKRQLEEMDEKANNRMKRTDRELSTYRMASRLMQDHYEEVEENNGKGFLSGVVYRGTKLSDIAKLRAGDEFVAPNMLSTSKEFITAKKFAVKQNPGAIIKFHLKGKGSVDVSDISRFDDEEEVLVPTKAKFRVVRNPQVCYREGLEKNAAELWEEDLEGKGKDELEKNSMKYNMIELEEVAGPNEEMVKKKKAKQAKRDRAREELLQRYGKLKEA